MASFQLKTENQIENARLVGSLKKPCFSTNNSNGHETWSCAFTHDETLFAWSCGNRYVVLVPWNRFKSCPAYVDNRDGNGNEIKSEQVSIDCGFLVWAVAFGSSTPVKEYLANNGGRSNLDSDHVLATGLSNGRIRIWSACNGRLVMDLMDHKSLVRDLAFAPDGSLRLVSASHDCTLKCWDLRDGGNMYKTLNGAGKRVVSCTWSPDAKLLASVGTGMTVLVWDMKDYKLLNKLEGHLHDVVSCDFSPDGALLATASWDTRVCLWDPITGMLLKTFGHLFPSPSLIFASGENGAWVRGVSFARDGCHVATVADDGYLRFWRIFGEDDPVQIAKVKDALCCAFSPLSSTVAVGSRDGSVNFWSSPVHLATLKHLSRKAIRQNVTYLDVPSLEVPRQLHGYLQFKEWM
jgi:WD repeat/SOCS box-containing protein 1